jgi:hypothetical protein
MAIANPKKLFVPHKTTPGATNYGTDMRTIENWANGLNPITQLTAGSGITLNPTDGEGPTVEISSSGGGTTLYYDFFGMVGLYDENAFQSFAIPLSAGDTSGVSVSNGQTNTVMLSNSGIDPAIYTMGNGWAVRTEANWAVTLPPYWFAPGYTGGGITGFWTIAAMSLDGLDYAFYYTGGETFTGGSSGQVPTSDFTASLGNYGTHLSLVPGPGNSEVGICADNVGMYFGMTQLILFVAPGTLFNLYH